MFDKEAEGFDFDSIIRRSSGLDKKLFTTTRDTVTGKGIVKEKPR